MGVAWNAATAFVALVLVFAELKITKKKKIMQESEKAVLTPCCRNKPPSSPCFIVRDRKSSTMVSGGQHRPEKLGAAGVAGCQGRGACCCLNHPRLRLP